MGTHQSLVSPTFLLLQRKPLRAELPTSLLLCLSSHQTLSQTGSLCSLKMRMLIPTPHSLHDRTRRRGCGAGTRKARSHGRPLHGVRTRAAAMAEGPRQSHPTPRSQLHDRGRRACTVSKAPGAGVPFTVARVDRDGPRRGSQGGRKRTSPSAVSCNFPSQREASGDRGPPM